MAQPERGRSKPLRCVESINSRPEAPNVYRRAGAPRGAAGVLDQAIHEGDHGAVGRGAMSWPGSTSAGPTTSRGRKIGRPVVWICFGATIATVGMLQPDQAAKVRLPHHRCPPTPDRPHDR